MAELAGKAALVTGHPGAPRASAFSAAWHARAPSVALTDAASADRAFVQSPEFKEESWSLG
jgi:hypothetical protein